MSPIILPKYWLTSATPFVLQEWIWHEITHEDWYAIKQRN